ncbi:tetratricopeptide repeat-containing sulfotransferase family protein [Rhodoferax sp.]|uniref:tetratricopeptide repeat-containing sulfotransferase family protein n=1 Tax=Rhodoferax sp. TaxID=50421 RepID=UPI0027233933|nr:tetratricopeptide repeat-containing sulfotransferase family protein [Rhodoferax sp.]MDO9197242.1 sulfotransferase [Rhodoferax sp.]
MTKKNVLTAGKKLKADQAARIGDRHQAQALYASVCKLDPMDIEAWVKLALIEKGLSNFKEAERCARRALALSPNQGYAHFALAQALHSLMQRDGAIASYRATIQLLPELADAHYLLGLVLHEQGAMTEATASLQHALTLRPSFPEALAELGAAYIDLGQVEAGLAYLHRAAALRPLDVMVQGNISHALRLLGKNQAALDNFRHALSLAPDNADLIAGLAGLLEKMSETDEAKSLLAHALALAPEHVASNLVAAQLERRKERLQQAVDRLQGLLTPTLAIDISGDIMLELGQIYDQMGDAVHAYPMIVEGKRRKAQATLSNQSDRGRDSYLTRLARIRQLATPELATALRHAMLGNDAEDHATVAPVFLIGFPRSGTTLMEQILDSHPGIQAMEEKPTVPFMVDRALQMLEERQCTLADLPDEQLAELRRLYFAEAARHITLVSGSLLIDKLPLNATLVPVIARVFPDAKFIVAIRHPCDVSLSCLMQNFAVNAAMANFFTLEDTAHLYAEVMGAWLHFAELLPLDHHQLRYEDLIEDVPAESRRLLDFLGLPWDDAVLKHTKHAQQRGAINTPSYHQVVQPVYQRSKYRWKRYEQQLGNVLPVLQPFIERFGYA